MLCSRSLEIFTWVSTQIKISLAWASLTAQVKNTFALSVFGLSAVLFQHFSRRVYIYTIYIWIKQYIYIYCGTHIYICMFFDGKVELTYYPFDTWDDVPRETTPWGFLMPRQKHHCLVFWWQNRWQEKNMWHAMGCQNGPKNLQGPPKPHFFFGSKAWRQKNGCFVLPKCKATNPFFFGGAIDDKKGMRGHRMGCQNWPKNEQRPPIP